MTYAQKNLSTQKEKKDPETWVSPADKVNGRKKSNQAPKNERSSQTHNLAFNVTQKT